MTISLNDVISHCRDRKYMSGVDRDRNRTKATQEVFTPTESVMRLIGTHDQEVYQDPEQTFLDNSCGDGQFLSEILIRKMELGVDFEQALSTLYGVDLMPDNVKLCQDRLLCGQEKYRHIVENNIVCANGLEYHYRFDGTQSEQRYAHWWQYESEIQRRKKEKGDLMTKWKGQETEVKNQKRIRREEKDKYKVREQELVDYINELESQLAQARGYEIS